MSKDYPLTPEEFEAIYAKVPRLTVEVVVRNADGALYLTQRDIEPCKGQWHLPGGTVYFGESLREAVVRIVRRELGIDVTEVRPNGFIEYPSHYLRGLDQPVGLVFEVTHYGGELQVDDEAASAGWFTALPSPMHADQDTYLAAHYGM